MTTSPDAELVRAAVALQAAIRDYYAAVTRRYAGDDAGARLATWQQAYADINTIIDQPETGGDDQ